MTENEFLLEDRLNVIRDTIAKYGEENFYLSFSGGKDSTVVHHLLDMAIPGNEIPRVFSNTGIEYNAIVEFVKDKQKKDDRFVVLYPKENIKKTLERIGYPFKNKEHSKKVDQYQRTRILSNYLREYLDGTGRKYGSQSKYICPPLLKYQFTDECTLRISHHCCDELKKRPAHKYEKETGRHILITGMMQEEGGARDHIQCIHFRDGIPYRFHPLSKVTNEWEEWFIKEHNIKLCVLYYEPYNFQRTGCKGCPFNINLQNELQTLERYFPSERRQCEIIWKPVYDEYRRIGYKLDKEEQMKLF